MTEKHIPDIVYIDDERDQRTIMALYLTKLFPDAKLHLASGAEEAFRILRRTNGNTKAIFSDYHMPKMNGLDLLVSSVIYVPGSDCLRTLVTGSDDPAVEKAAVDSGVYFRRRTSNKNDAQALREAYVFFQKIRMD